MTTYAMGPVPIAVFSTFHSELLNVYLQKCFILCVYQYPRCCYYTVSCVVEIISANENQD